MCNEAALIAARDGATKVEDIHFSSAIERVIGGKVYDNTGIPLSGVALISNRMQVLRRKLEFCNLRRKKLLPITKPATLSSVGFYNTPIRYSKSP